MSYQEADAVEVRDVKREEDDNYSEVGWVAKAGATLAGIGVFLGVAFPLQAQEKPDLDERIHEASMEAVEKIKNDNYGSEVYFYSARKSEADVQENSHLFIVAADTTDITDQAAIYFQTGEEDWKYITFEPTEIQGGKFIEDERDMYREVLAGEGRYRVLFNSDGNYYYAKVIDAAEEPIKEIVEQGIGLYELEPDMLYPGSQEP